MIDSHLHMARHRASDGLKNTSAGTFLRGKGDGSRVDLGGVLEWDDDDDDAGNDAAGGSGDGRPTLFRSVLDHPRLLPYYHKLLGKGYRMDHLPFCILQDQGSEGFSLHGGTTDCETGSFNHDIMYSCRNGEIRNNLLAVAVSVAPQPMGGGGFCVVKGSHKMNFPLPKSMITGDSNQEHIQQVETSPGDVVLFSEGTVHGAMPWRNDFQRRVALYRFSPATCCYGRSYFSGEKMGWHDRVLSGLSERQRHVLQPPFANRLDRYQIEEGGGEKVQSRSDEKKMHDRQVFQNKYF